MQPVLLWVFLLINASRIPETAGFAMGGFIPHFDTGGSVWVGEDGPEIGKSSRWFLRQQRTRFSKYGADTVRRSLSTTCQRLPRILRRMCWHSRQY